ncbi:type II toxin-antitoxin system HipA family toxin [Rahnella woolbedingensis]|uniref:Type II toxin-antitoxin system HipA family toxin n=1 Tax=Rahnella woolbedingensis TaxID=1510574 RepID=A0A419N3L4_9GAMM|nr:HipA domain-containing protein [Rahnella woolbedingensis]RJT37425.1 type II toxin-antitoxin system HipA family toxin [Rahnella woolbedingensis]
MNSEHCLINLSRLKGAEIETGYSRKGIKLLLQNPRVMPDLPFTRRQFIQEQPERQKGMSISGYQPKLSLAIEDNEFRVESNGGTYILKPSPEEYPHLAENEHATMTVMARLKFVVPAFGLVRFRKEQKDQQGELAFVIRRYDRGQMGEERMHQEQLDGAIGIHDKYGAIDDKKAVSYQRAARFLLDNLGNNLTNKRDIFLRIVYAYVLGNNDFHLRNFGILLPRNAPPSLAPVYDFISVVPYPAAFGEYLALPLLEREENGEDIAPGLDSSYGEYTGADFVSLGEGIGIQNQLARKWLANVIRNHRLIIDTYNESHMPAEPRDKVLEYVSRRMHLLEVMDLP